MAYDIPIATTNCRRGCYARKRYNATCNHNNEDQRKVLFWFFGLSRNFSEEHRWEMIIYMCVCVGVCVCVRVCLTSRLPCSVWVYRECRIVGILFQESTP